MRRSLSNFDFDSDREDCTKLQIEDKFLTFLLDFSQDLGGVQLSINTVFPGGDLAKQICLPVPLHLHLQNSCQKAKVRSAPRELERPSHKNWFFSSKAPQLAKQLKAKLGTYSKIFHQLHSFFFRCSTVLLCPSLCSRGRCTPSAARWCSNTILLLLFITSNTGNNIRY